MTKNLIDGFKSFRDAHYEGKNALMPYLAEKGQSPDFFIVSCIDSRGNPGTIFDAVPGTFFSHKAMGAIVRPYKKGTALSAALQFAIIHNKITDVIILGHTGCGAIKALVEQIDDEEISSFISVAQKGLERAQHLCGPTCTPPGLLRHAEEQIVLQSAENLRGYPSVAQALNENRLTIHSWIFDMTQGDILSWNVQSETFESLLNEPQMLGKKRTRM
jgi:carbonic anhydrase